MSKINDYGVLFPTSVVGSMPRPDFVRDFVSAWAKVMELDRA